MPIHDWTRVDAGTFHGFHVTWLSELAGKLNQLLPARYYALPERKALGLEPDVVTLDFGSPDDETHRGKQRVVAIRRAAGDRIVAIIELVSPGNKSSSKSIRAFVAKAIEFLEMGVHVHVIDLFPPTPRDPHGIHQAIWNAYSSLPSASPAKPLTIATYMAGEEERAFVESVAVGDRLPDMPLILEPDLYIFAPLEETYMLAFEKFPRRWREVLTAPAA